MGLGHFISAGVAMKACSSCKAELPESSFYSDRRRPDGLKSQCKKCHCISTLICRDPRKSRETNKQWMRRSGYARRPEVMERERKRARVKNATIEAKARILANRAVDLGFLARPTNCAKCGAAGSVHAHHDDYAKPLEVVWLCVPCHGVVHRAVQFKRVTP